MKDSYIDRPNRLELRELLRAISLPVQRESHSPDNQRCPYIDKGCGSLCLYDFGTRPGSIDGRCLTKAAALAKK